MKIIIFGAGRQGRRILDLLLADEKYSISIYDKSKDVLKKLKKAYKDKIEFLKGIPAYESQSFKKFLDSFDLIVDALPSIESYKLMKECVRAGKKMVSVSYLEEDYMEFDLEAKKRKAVIIPDCGAAPGLSHLFAGYSAKRLNNPEKVIMKVGALPEKPLPPFYHNITWSAYDLIQEYIRYAKIKKNGKILRKKPLETMYQENLLGIELESFLTDGVRSFFHSFPEIANVEERTLRHKGHLDFMKALDSIGLLKNREIKTEKFSIIPSEFLAHIFESELKNLPAEDLFIMEVSVENKKEKETHLYLMKFDKKNRISALVNSVAITAFIAIKMLSSGKIKNYGVLPLEKIVDDDIYKSMVKAHIEFGAEYRFEKNEKG